VRSGINPQHTLSIQAAHDLFGLDLEVKEEKPIVRIGETGDSVATMQTDAPRYLLKTSRSHYSDQEIRQTKIKFRRFEYLCPIMELPDEVLEFLLEKYLFKRKVRSLAYCH